MNIKELCKISRWEHLENDSDATQTLVDYIKQHDITTKRINSIVFYRLLQNSVLLNNVIKQLNEQDIYYVAQYIKWNQWSERSHCDMQTIFYMAMLDNYFVYDRQYTFVLKDMITVYCFLKYFCRYLRRKVVSRTELPILIVNFLKYRGIFDYPKLIHKVIDINLYKRNFNILFSMLRFCTMTNEEHKLHMQYAIQLVKSRQFYLQNVKAILCFATREEDKQELQSILTIKQLQQE